MRGNKGLKAARRAFALAMGALLVWQSLGSNVTYALAEDVVAASATTTATETAQGDAEPDDVARQVANADFREVSQGVTVKIYKDKEHKQELGDEAVTANTKLYGTIDIAYDPAEKPTVSSPNVKYTLPSNIRIDDTNPSTLYDGTTNSVAGTWYIKDGVIYLEYNQEWLKKENSDIVANLSFGFDTGSNPTGDGSWVEVQFPGTSSTVKINTKDGGVSGDKWANDNGAFSADDNTYTWTIRVSPDSFATNLVLHDKLGSSLEYVKDSFQLVDANSSPTGASLDVTYPEDGKAEIALGSLPKGDYYVQYKTKLRDGVLDGLKDNQELSGLDNSVSWSWGTDGSHNNGWDVKKEPQKVKYSMVSKSASGENTDILWTVRLNNGTLKADMDGYAFSDTLGSGQHFKAGTRYEVRDASGNLLLSGDVDPASDTLGFTMPASVGKQQVTVTYHCEMDDASSADAVSNTANVTPPNGSGPSGEGSGSYQPSDDRTYITKELADASTAETDGYATWKTEVKFSAMGASTDPSQVVLSDEINRSTWEQIKFDQVRLVTSDGTELVEGVDYAFGGGNNPDWNKLVIQFKDSDTVRALLGQGDVIVTYRTKCSGENGTYTNRASLKVSGVDKGDAEAHYTIDKEVVPPVSKKAGTPHWDASYDWGDGTKGAWIADWTVHVNCYEPNDWTHAPASDLAGADVTVSDTFDEGLTYVEGSAQYNAIATVGTSAWQQRAMPTLEGQNVTFTIPTSALANEQGSWRGYVELKYQTATRSDVAEPGASVTLGNTASASAGDKQFPQGSATTTITNKVLDKKGARASDGSHVTYTIEVNENKLKLSGSGTIRLVDVLGVGGQFTNGSLVVSENGVPLTEGVSYSFENITTDDGQPATRLTIEVPDERALTITYDVAPQGALNQEVQIDNEVSVYGYKHASSSDNNKWEVTESNGGSHGVNYGLIVNKTDETGAEALAGAKFSLYQVDLDESVAQGKIVATLDEDCGTNPAVTDANGQVRFGTEGIPLESATLYYFEEDEAPAGYEVTNPEPIYVMFCGTTSQEVSAYNAALAKCAQLGITPSAARSINVYDRKSDEVVPSGKATIGVEKLVNGAAPAEGQSFEFELTGQDGAPMPSVTAATTVGGARASFGDITFGTSDEGKTYTYTISETSELGTGWTKASPVTVTVAVGVPSEDDPATIPVTVSYGSRGSEDGQAAVFNNTYEANGAATLVVAKRVNGSDPQSGQSFRFGLSALTDGAPMPETDDGSVATTVGASMAQFGEIRFGLADAGRIYEYRIHELTQAGSGWTNAPDVIATVTVGADQGDGTLGPCSVTYRQDVDGADAYEGDALFDNAYAEASGVFALSVVKTVNGGAVHEGEAFSFSATAEGENADIAPAIADVTTGVGGSASFAQVPLGDWVEGKTLTYRIHETSELADGWTNAPDVIATVTVGTRDEEGVLPVSVTYRQDADGAESYEGSALFDNAHVTAPATATPTVAKSVKTLDGCDYHVTAGQFSFTLRAVSAPDGAEPVADRVASCADGGAASFGELTFPVPGTYVFRVSENDVDAALAPNVAHDGTVYTLAYVVEEGADRDLHVTSTTVTPSIADDEHAASESDRGIAFVNHETPTTPSTPATPDVPATPMAPEMPTTAPMPHDEHHMPQTGDALGTVRLAAVLVVAAGVGCVALGLAEARRRMMR